jgi:hypothetical protein
MICRAAGSSVGFGFCGNARASPNNCGLFRGLGGGCKDGLAERSHILASGSKLAPESVSRHLLIQAFADLVGGARKPGESEAERFDLIVAGNREIRPAGETMRDEFQWLLALHDRRDNPRGEVGEREHMADLARIGTAVRGNNGKCCIRAVGGLLEIEMSPGDQVDQTSIG